jgi:hypothetical protein
MLRWDTIEDKELYDIEVKMYRDPFIAKTTIKALYKNVELDHYAYKYLGSELYMYRILDTNFVNYIEERGDISRIKNILIPTEQDTTKTVY